MVSESRARTAAAGSTQFFMACILSLLASCGTSNREGDAKTGGESELHQGEVHLDEAQRAAAGIATAPAMSGSFEETLHLVARVASNEDTVVHVTPPIPGIVQEIHKGLGDQVVTGEPLVEIWSVELGDSSNAWLQARATVTAAEETLAKSQQLYRQRLETATKVLDGEIEVARKIYEREDELQQKSISTIRPFLEAEKVLLQAKLARERELLTLTAERDTRLLDLELALRKASIEETAARERLRVLGFQDAEIEALEKSGSRHGRMVLRAPRDGVVVERHVTRNEHVGTGDTLFVIHDLATVWVLASAYEKDLSSLRTGQKAYVCLDALPGTNLVGEVSLIDFRIAAVTRASSVRIVLPNQRVDGWPVDLPLRPGMFGEVEVVVAARTGRVVLPEAAIVHEGEEQFVFVQGKGAPGTYLRKPVTMRRGARDLVEITAGVEPGEDIVVEGTFALKSLARSEELGEGEGH